MLKLMFTDEQILSNPIVIEIKADPLGSVEGNTLFVNDILEIDAKDISDSLEIDNANIITLNQSDVIFESSTISSTVDSYVIQYDPKVHNQSNYYSTLTCSTNFGKQSDSSNPKRLKSRRSRKRLSLDRPKNKEEKPTTCDVCGKTFKNNRYLRKHQSIHSDLRPHKCSKCSRSFLRRPNLIRHLLLHEKKKKPKKPKVDSILECNICGKIFNQRLNFTKHLKVHIGERPHKCSKCNKGFSRFHDLKQHIYRHTISRQFSCPTCDVKFKLLAHLKRHLEKHNNNVEHKKRKRKKEKNEIPSLHISEDISLTGLEKYVDLCMDTEQGISDDVICNISDDVLEFFVSNVNTAEANDLDKHLTVQPEGNLFLCDKCSKTFKHKKNLRKHLKTHAQVRPHKCSTCSRAFIRMTDLKRHTLTHTMDRPYICSWCKVSYRQNETLKKHINRVHKH